MSNRRPIYIDNCVVDRFAASDIDPVAQLTESEFEIVVTPDLASEYQQALVHPRVKPKSKTLIRKLLDCSRELGVFGFDGPPFSGFGHGCFASPTGAATINSIPVHSRSRNSIPKNRTDAFLLALADDAIVITNDQKKPWKGRQLSGVVLWSEIENANARQKTFLDFLRTKYPKQST